MLTWVWRKLLLFLSSINQTNAFLSYVCVSTYLYNLSILFIHKYYKYGGRERKRYDFNDRNTL